MDVFYYTAYYTGLLLAPIVVYFVFFRKNDGRSLYSERDWFYTIKLYAAKKRVQKYQDKYRDFAKRLGRKLENEIQIPTNIEQTISQSFNGVDQVGNSISLKLVIGIDKIAEARLLLRLADGNSYVFPGEEGTIQTNLSKGQWKIGGVNIEILEDFQRLRITFNGLLRNLSSIKSDIEHVQFNFIFTACESPSYIPQDIDKTALADALARETWRDGSWVENLVDQWGFDQFGAMKGFIKGDSYPEEYVLNLPAFRTNYRGIDDRFLNDRAVRIFIVDTYGNLLNLVMKSIKNGCSQVNYGFAFLSNHERSAITDTDIQLKTMGENKILPSVISALIKTKRKDFRAVIHLNTDRVWRSGINTKYGYESKLVPAECNLNLNRGKVMVEFWYSKKGDRIFIPERRLCEKTVETLPSTLVTNIKSGDSEILDITGGKGNSLALMASMNSKDFIVPEGFILTVNAYQLQLNSKPVLVKSIEFLNDICCGKMEGRLEEACKETVSYFKETHICPEIVEAITEELSKYSNVEDHIGWAVRSSAIGEDSEELSAAGQNETFLGCQSTTQILESISACWASLYTYQSVLYRWQHGLPVRADMAVVVQKMVAAECAGVLFTCHPSTSNPREMIITSNFGLGETVVSGNSDPDTFILNRTWDNTISLKHKSIGNKNVVLTMTSEGVKETSMNNDNERWSLSDEQAIRLGKIGVQLEKIFGNHRDIEWAFYKDQLYLLQSRPITTLNAWTDFELGHEMDSPILTDKSIATFGNIREVIPNATTVLSYSSSIRVMDECIQKFPQLNYDPMARKGLITFKHNVMMDFVMSVHKNVSPKPIMSSLILDLAIFGHPVLNEEINELLVNRLGITPALKKLKETWGIIGLARKLKLIVQQAQSLTKELNYNSRENAALSEIVENIFSTFGTLVEIALCHSGTSTVSVFYQIVLMNIMLEGQEEFGTDHISDFALILSSCEDVISAEIPKNLEEIAKEIKNQGNSEEFCTMKKELGIDWIEKNCPAANKLLQIFLKNHGHRSLGEFEVITESWAENPSALIPMIQSNIKHGRNVEKVKMSLDDVLANLTSPKKSSTRYIIKFLINKLRVAVGCREQTKSELVRGFDKLRMAYRHLSQRMVSEGLLPSKDLIYHLTHEEIQKIIQKRDPVLINKAIRRQKLYTKWNSLKFPEIMYGIPAPEPESETGFQINPLTKKCKGTPVCTGVVQARACVINSLQEIGQLQTGDILITYSTDIGWSPYFPMLSGIVTELGGLISHGAVVAREYGLPCIVGVQNATKYFTTGEILVLNGKTGELGKL
ncbi:unnamed protein product [Phaedon cochleariae]|uniref:Phosphoenolpyruvate synthase n=1 Tax=Phaedon cochleariae TaxID=80249 RepID=A0A9N9WYE7_PHACE|nr:unnamed protein product [Phaedon cochleariae]